MVGKWKDKRDVLYISNEYSNEMIEFTDKRGCDREKPKPVLEYNKHMGGVDRQDQLNSYYPCERKMLRWYKKLGIHFIHLMLLNSYLLYKNYSGRNLPLYDFRIFVLEQLLHIQQPRTPKIRTLAARHMLTKIVAKNEKGETCRKRCRVCSNKKIRKSTLYHREVCPECKFFDFFDNESYFLFIVFRICNFCRILISLFLE
jgi:hypothetical protein